jgi:proton-translocating NADH-quinone oxidoreductase chain L
MTGVMHNFAWIVPALPLFSFLTVIFFGYKLKDRASHLLATWMMMFTIILSFIILLEKLTGAAPAQFIQAFPWVSVGNLSIPFTTNLDNIAAMTLFMVSVTAGMIHLFSQGYMRGDVRYSRFFAFISLFSFSMFGVVLTDHFISFLVFWEIMGFCSYALIGFYFEKRSAQLAMKKAFIVTRIGDVGMLLGIFMLYYSGAPLRFSEMVGYFAPGNLTLSTSVTTIIGLLLFCGAVGKSAQFPLHVWLPDAMEGPTPVSALIHAATMVSAGVFLVLRIFPIIAASEVSLAVVAAVGAFTAVITALIGLVMNDIKKVLAYSTMSQLGYMFLALGVAGYTAGAFHLINHAFFKACLFLGSGSVILGCHHEQDMRRMGGLQKFMPITYATFLIASLSLMGIPPFSGFWSKDEILGNAFARAQEFGGAYWLLFIAGELVAFLTAMYMTRLLILTFAGKYRGNDAPGGDYLADKAALQAEQAKWETRKYGASMGGLETLYHEDKEHTAPSEHGKDDHSHGHHAHTPQESPWVITAALVVLATFGGFFGLVGAAPLGIHWWQGFIHFGEGHEGVNWLVMGISTVMAFGGLLTGYLVWGAKLPVFQALHKLAAVKIVHSILSHKYYIDEFYNGVIIRGLVLSAIGLWKFDMWVIDMLVNAIGAGTKGLAYAYSWFDHWVVDGTVNLAGMMWLGLKWCIKPVQSGYIQHYVLAILITAVVFWVARYLF